MGAFMAALFARRGYEVYLYNRSEKGLDRARKSIELSREELARTGETTRESANEPNKRLFFGTDISALAGADFVIETIVEDMEMKKRFLAELSRLMDEDGVLATNTSGLSISELGKDVRVPRRFAGMHWINPPHLVPLIEVIAGSETCPETLGIISGLARKIGKRPVSVKKDVPGFLLNRLQFALLREALYIVEHEIADPQDVDDTVRYGLGLRYAAVGPFETADLGGLDAFYKVGSYLFRDLCDGGEVPESLARLYREGAYGVKTGRGFYDYSGGKTEEAVKKRDDVLRKLLDCLWEDAD